MIFNKFVDYPTLMLKFSFKDFLSSMIAKAKKTAQVCQNCCAVFKPIFKDKKNHFFLD